MFKNSIMILGGARLDIEIEQVKTPYNHQEHQFAN